MRVKYVDHIAIQTNDLDNSINFYVKILGLELLNQGTFKKRKFALLKCGNLSIELFSKKIDDNLITWSDLFTGPVHLSFVVENLNAFVLHAKKNDVSFHPSHPGPFVPPFAQKEIVYLLGPDGEEVEIREDSLIEAVMKSGSKFMV